MAGLDTPREVPPVDGGTQEVHNIDKATHYANAETVRGRITGLGIKDAGHRIGRAPPGSSGSLHPSVRKQSAAEHSDLVDELRDRPAEDSDGPGEASKLGVDQSKDARDAQARIHELLDVSEELSCLPKEMRTAVKALIDRAVSKLDELVAQGPNVQPSQALVVVLIWKDSDDELESKARASDGDGEIIRAIQDKFAKAYVPFWTALASLTSVKQWSASLEISAGLPFAVKGTGGISVTFGR